jgi:glycosyltransferase involved in cell wall biosynthesis
MREAFAVITTSPWANRRVLGLHRLDADRVHVVEPGVDPAPKAAGSDGTRLLALASITPRKGHDLLVRALAGIAELPWTCVCVGSLQRDPDHVAAVRDLIAEHGLDDRMTLAGALPDDELEKFFHETDLLVLPSRRETYGMVVTEALARGVPVLTTAVDALPETLGQDPNGSTPGILVPPGDAPALTRALRLWLTEPRLRDRLRVSAGNRRLDDWNTAGRRLADVLDHLRGEPW